jgi:hypothetical protein
MNPYENGHSPEAAANLRSSRKEPAAARRRAAQTAGKPTAAKPAARTPAKKATPKPAKKATATVRWTLLEERQPGKGAVPMDGSCAGHTWAVRRAEGGWTVTHTDPAGKATLLTEKPVAYGTAYDLVRDAAKAVAK